MLPEHAILRLGLAAARQRNAELRAQPRERGGDGTTQKRDVPDSTQPRARPPELGRGAACARAKRLDYDDDQSTALRPVKGCASVIQVRSRGRARVDRRRTRS